MSPMILVLAVFAVVLLATLLVARRHPGWQRAAPYLFIFSAIVYGYLGATAYQRVAWWFVPSLGFLILAVVEFLRQRKIARTGH